MICQRLRNSLDFHYKRITDWTFIVFSVANIFHFLHIFVLFLSRMDNKSSMYQVLFGCDSLSFTNIFKYLRTFKKSSARLKYRFKCDAGAHWISLSLIADIIRKYHLSNLLSHNGSWKWCNNNKLIEIVIFFFFSKFRLWCVISAEINSVEFFFSLTFPFGGCKKTPLIAFANKSIQSLSI